MVQKDGSDTSRTNEQRATENQNSLNKLTSFFFQGSVDQRGGSGAGANRAAAAAAAAEDFSRIESCCKR